MNLSMIFTIQNDERRAITRSALLLNVIIVTYNEKWNFSLCSRVNETRKFNLNLN